MIKLIPSALTAQKINLPKLTSHEVCNPSVINLGKKLYVVYKGINYNLQNDAYSKMQYGGFFVPFSDSQNYFAVIDPAKDLKIESIGFLEDRHIRASQFALNGLQDIRIFYWLDNIYALAAAITHNLSEESDIPVKQTSMLLCNISGNTLNPISLFPSKQQHEKNWMPWVREENLFLIYHNDPYQILHYEKNSLSQIETKEVSSLKFQSGGSAVIPFGENFIGIVHQKNHGAIIDNNRNGLLMSYFHKVIIFGPDFDILDTSPSFTFEGERIEFCCGIALLDDKNIILTYGVWDNQAIVAKISTKEFLNILSLDKWN